MNKESQHEGWLIKSPPTKRIWRARWRRRWFTLKQGEIPGQFCLEYYTDHNCRKLKGVIDLDQCEQVDSGLRLENRKQKFQFMFDIKTPKRTYYLAADTEKDMRDWVNCICQVCHLHDTKQSNELPPPPPSQPLQQAPLPTATAIDDVRSYAAANSNGCTSAHPLNNSNANNTTTTSLNSTTSFSLPAAAGVRGAVVVDQQPLAANASMSSSGLCSYRNNNNNNNSSSSNNNHNNTPNNSDSAYVNTSDYCNRETLLLSDAIAETAAAAAVAAAQLRPLPLQLHLQQQQQQQQQLLQTPPSPSVAAVYLNSPLFGALAQTPPGLPAARLAVNANGVVRKIPENLVLSQTTLPSVVAAAATAATVGGGGDPASLQAAGSSASSVQPSPALSTASGPYIPISECFSGSPKFAMDINGGGAGGVGAGGGGGGAGNNPTTPLNNLDPKFYDTPRSHSHNIGNLNLTNDQSYSPKITNCSVPPPSGMMMNAKGRVHRSDSDSESVFTDDDEWSHPLPLRENVDRSTRPSDSSIENESFVVTYSQRFSKMPDGTTAGAQDDSPGGVEDGGGMASSGAVRSTHVNGEIGSGQQAVAGSNGGGCGGGGGGGGTLGKLAKSLNLILDFKEHDKLPQLSDTENTSPAIGPRDSRSVVAEESYDIPRSHNLPYYNMSQMFEKLATSAAAATSSPEANPMAASTPNLLADSATAAAGDAALTPMSAASVRTLSRPHFYTNAAPSKVDGNYFRYDFFEHGEVPPVNRKLKPKMASLEDKPPEEMAAKPPVTAAAAGSAAAAAIGVPYPPSVDRKLKPNAYRASNSATLASSVRRSTGAPLSMVLAGDLADTYFNETYTLPRQPRPPNYALSGGGSHHNTSAGLASSSPLAGGGALGAQHQRTASAAAAMQVSWLANSLASAAAGQATAAPAGAGSSTTTATATTGGGKNEHRLQYFDLDVANAPSINRQSMSVGNLNASSVGGGLAGGGVGGGGGAVGVGGGAATAGGRFPGLSADPSARAPVKSSVVYNSVDFVKTEAFKRIREERKKESVVAAGGGGGSGSSAASAGGNK